MNRSGANFELLDSWKHFQASAPPGTQLDVTKRGGIHPLPNMVKSFGLVWFGNCHRSSLQDLEVNMLSVSCQCEKTLGKTGLALWFLQLNDLFRLQRLDLLGNYISLGIQHDRWDGVIQHDRWDGVNLYRFRIMDDDRSYDQHQMRDI